MWAVRLQQRQQQRSQIRYPCSWMTLTEKLVLSVIDGQVRRVFMGKISRRLMMRIIVIYAALAGTDSVRAETKVAQKLVGYQSKPVGPAQCNNCRHFEPPSSCKVVEGDIAPTGWCRLYAKQK